MESIQAYLRLSTNLNGTTRERCPDVVFMEGDQEIATIRTDTEVPTLPYGDGEVRELIIHDDALSRVIDEEAWMRELERVLAPEGQLRFTLPAENVFAWIDTMNAHRYLADITGRGHAPDAANPTGWNRHYTREHIDKLVERAGFDPPEVRGQNNALQEVGFLSCLLWRNWIQGKRKAELEHFPRFGARKPGRSSGLMLTTWNVIARKRHT